MSNIIKHYDFLTEKQNQLINMDLTQYATEQQIEDILGLYEKEFKIKSIATVVDLPSFVVKQILLKHDIDEAEKGAEYIALSKGQDDYGSLYAVFTDMELLRRSKWIYCKEMGIKPSSIQYPFSIHHINFYVPRGGETPEELKETFQNNKFNDNFLNLCLTINDNNRMHRIIHSKGITDIDELEKYIYEAIKDQFEELEERKIYIDTNDFSGLRELQKEFDKLKKYLKLVKKQFELQRTKRNTSQVRSKESI